MRSWKRSQVLVPSPQGDLRTVSLRVFVGMRTGPFTLRSFYLAPRMRSAHTFSRFATFLEVSVMRMRCTRCSTASSLPAPGAL
jgi:hypothetical protein